MNVQSPAGEAPAPSDPSLRQALRAFTRQSHERLDGAFAPMLENLDLGAYREFIRMNQACHGAVEAALAGGPLEACLPDWPNWTRLPDLERDLATLKLTPLDPPPFPVRIDGLPEALGTAYVLEGSRIGAVFIHRRFLAADVAARWGEASFHYVGGGQERRFRLFMDALSQVDFSSDETRACLEAAASTFDYFMIVAQAARSSTNAQASPT